MIKLRTKLLLLLMVLCGVGIGVVSRFADGLYSAILLFIFPFLVALTAGSVISDFSTTASATTKPAEQKASERKSAGMDLPHAA